MRSTSPAFVFAAAFSLLLGGGYAVARLRVPKKGPSKAEMSAQGAKACCLEHAAAGGCPEHGKAGHRDCPLHGEKAARPVASPEGASGRLPEGHPAPPLDESKLAAGRAADCPYLRAGKTPAGKTPLEEWLAGGETKRGGPR